MINYVIHLILNENFIWGIFSYDFRNRIYYLLLKSKSKFFRYHMVDLSSQLLLLILGFVVGLTVLACELTMYR